MTSIPLINERMLMLTDKLDKVAERVEDEAKKAQFHREEALKFHATLLEKLETKFAWKWTEKLLIFIWWVMGTAIIWAFMALIFKKI